MQKLVYAPFEYSTGRTYDAPQVLTITVENKWSDEFGITEFTARFVDPSRHISGRVKSLVFGQEPIGAAVLAAYDAGQYSPL